jgi:hypothetical protein
MGQLEEALCDARKPEVKPEVYRDIVKAFTDLRTEIFVLREQRKTVEKKA